MLSDCAEDALMAPYPERTLEESLAGTGLRRFVGHWRERPAQDETAEASERCEPALHAPQRWGLSAGICLRRDSWNTTAVTQKCMACPSLAARGFRSLKPLWYDGVPP